MTGSLETIRCDRILLFSKCETYNIIWTVNFALLQPTWREDCPSGVHEPWYYFGINPPLMNQPIMASYCTGQRLDPIYTSLIPRLYLHTVHCTEVGPHTELHQYIQHCTALNRSWTSYSIAPKFNSTAQACTNLMYKPALTWCTRLHRTAHDCTAITLSVEGPAISGLQSAARLDWVSGIGAVWKWGTKCPY